MRRSALQLVHFCCSSANERAILAIYQQSLCSNSCHAELSKWLGLFLLSCTFVRKFPWPHFGSMMKLLFRNTVPTVNLHASDSLLQEVWNQLESLVRRLWNGCAIDASLQSVTCEPKLTIKSMWLDLNLSPEIRVSDWFGTMAIKKPMWNCSFRLVSKAGFGHVYKGLSRAALNTGVLKIYGNHNSLLPFVPRHCHCVMLSELNDTNMSFQKLTIKHGGQARQPFGEVIVTSIATRGLWLRMCHAACLVHLAALFQCSFSALLVVPTYETSWFFDCWMQTNDTCSRHEGELRLSKITAIHCKTLHPNPRNCRP